MKVLTVKPVRQVLHRERQIQALGTAHETDPPTEPLHGESVQRQQILGDPERRLKQCRRDPVDVGLLRTRTRPTTARVRSVKRSARRGPSPG